MSDLMQIEKSLKAPFHPDDIEWRVGSTTKDKSRGLALAYVTNRAIQNRLDEVFGIAGWKNEFKDWKGSGVLCGISCLINGEWLTKWDGAEETNMEATKGGLSDAMKRAGYQWGIGRYLYSIPQTWVALKNEKYLAETPKLPGWALPEGFSYGKPPKNESDQFWMGEHKVSDPLPNNATQQDALKPLENKEDPILKCSSCGDAITTKVLDYSKQKFGKALCMKCQNEAKKVGAK